MGVKYVKNFSFPKSGGFHTNNVQRYAKGGAVRKANGGAAGKPMPFDHLPIVDLPMVDLPMVDIPAADDFIPLPKDPTRSAPIKSMPVKKMPVRRNPAAEAAKRAASDMRSRPPLTEFSDLEQAFGKRILRPGMEEPQMLVEAPSAPAPRKPAKDEAVFGRPVVRTPAAPSRDVDYDSMPIGVMGGGEGYWSPGGGKDRQAEATRKWRESQGLPPTSSTPFDEAAKIRLVEDMMRAGIKIPQMSRRAKPIAQPVSDRMMMDRMPTRRVVAPRVSAKEPTFTRPRVPGMTRGLPGSRSQYSSPVAMIGPEDEQLFTALSRNTRTPVAPSRVRAYAKGGKVTGKKGQAKVAKVMREYKEGKLHSGSKKGPKVTNPKQAMAIALSEARAMKKAKGGEVKKPKKEEGKKPKMKMEDMALKKMRHAEKYAPGMDLDNIHSYELSQEAKKEKKVEKYAKGGKVHSDVKMDKAMMKKAVHKHEKAMHPGKPLTKLRRGGVPAHSGKPMYGGGKC